jgi:group II intron reverse transcriptase/maturase
MLSARLIKKLEGIEKCSKHGHKARNLFQILTNNPELWMQAYAQIYPNKGALTKGMGETTIDGFCGDRVANLVKLLKEGRYQPKPSRRVYIRKANGKQRPLGIQSGDDKLVQEVMRILLERVYEPVFSDDSHGFRAGRSCHTALPEIRRKWTATKWLINIDVENYFNNIDHRILINLLEQKIDDRRFIKLVKSMLRAGHLEQWRFQRTYSGTPQGSGCSPIIANIYLHELDKFVEELRLNFDRGKERRSNPEYNSLRLKIRRLKKKVDELSKNSEEAQRLSDQIGQLDRQRRSIPSGDVNDPDYKRVYYSRYADDTLLGVIGSKDDAQKIMEQVKTFLTQRLNLPISEEKSGITHAREGMIFLGYEIRTYASRKVIKIKIGEKHTRKRTVNQKMDLYVPEERVKKFCQARGYGEYDRLESHHRASLIYLSDYEIIRTYNDELRGFANYYGLAHDVKRKLNRLENMSRYSLFKTLAAKHRSSVTKTALRLKVKGDFVYQYRINGEDKGIKVYKLKDLVLEPKTWEKIDLLPDTRIYERRSEILDRLNAQICEYCGQEDGYFEVHHVRKLSDMKDGKEKWQKLMIARQRKTMVLCVECHDLLHAGKLPSWRSSMYERSGEPCAVNTARTVRRGAYAYTAEV